MHVVVQRKTEFSACTLLGVCILVEFFVGCMFTREGFVLHDVNYCLVEHVQQLSRFPSRNKLHWYQGVQEKLNSFRLMIYSCVPRVE